MVATPVRHIPKKWNEEKKVWELQFNERHSAFLRELQLMSEDENCPYEFIYSTVEGGRTWGRCRLVTNFRRMRRQFPQLKWLLWKDDDVDLTGAGVLRLLSHKLPIVGAMYTNKDDDENKLDPNVHWVANFMHEVELQPSGLLQVVELGLGALLTHWQVYDAIESVNEHLVYTDRTTGEKHFGFFQEIVIEKVPYSEDYFFCFLARHAKILSPTEEDPKRVVVGIGIFADTQLKLLHYDGEGMAHPIEFPPIPIDEKFEEGD